jgi:hypothetical protein
MQSLHEFLRTAINQPPSPRFIPVAKQYLYESF